MPNSTDENFEMPSEEVFAEQKQQSSRLIEQARLMVASSGKLRERGINTVINHLQGCQSV